MFSKRHPLSAHPPSGISNFVTGIAAAYWAHSPVIALTPEAGTMTKGLGGFQEMDQLPIFEVSLFFFLKNFKTMFHWGFVKNILKLVKKSALKSPLPKKRGVFKAFLLFSLRYVWAAAGKLNKASHWTDGLRCISVQKKTYIASVGFLVKPVYLAQGSFFR